MGGERIYPKGVVHGTVPLLTCLSRQDFDRRSLSHRGLVTKRQRTLSSRTVLLIHSTKIAE